MLDTMRVLLSRAVVLVSSAALLGATLISSSATAANSAWLSGDQQMLRSMNVRRSPKSVTGVIDPPLAGNRHRLVVTPSTSAVASHWSSGDKET